MFYLKVVGTSPGSSGKNIYNNPLMKPINKIRIIAVKLKGQKFVGKTDSIFVNKGWMISSKNCIRIGNQKACSQESIIYATVIRTNKVNSTIIQTSIIIIFELNY